MTIRNAFLIVFFCCFTATALSARNAKLSLDERTIKQVNELLNETTDFQTALHEQKDVKIRQEIIELSKKIEGFLNDLGDYQIQNQGMHLKKILQSTKNYLESYQNLESPEKKITNLKKAFSQLVQLVRMYKVDKQYRIYYCKSDNSEWIQKGWRAKNPIHPEKYGKCGQRAYR